MFTSSLKYYLRKVRGKVGKCFNSYTTIENVMENPVVTVKEGRLKGAVKKLLDGSEYYSFKGVPYANPPTGNLRFKAPLPLKPWQGIYEAVEHGAVCPQLDFNTMEITEGSEDCLFLNVYTKSLQSNSKLPVMVYIHGGGFVSGSGDSRTYGPEFLLQHDVIVVTLNYRLEALGFLCLDIPEVPGNAGLKDQVAALRWVQRNISQFGGDPDNVTLFGESAGGSSVTYHMLSPMSKGLFHKAITQSGVAISDWSCGKDGKNRAFRVGKLLGVETDDVNELLEYLQKLPATKLAYVTNRSRTNDEKHRGLPLHFVPVVEKKFDNVESFINEESIDVLLGKNLNRVPLIAGYNVSEGQMSVADRMKKLKFITENPKYLLPRELAQKLTDDETMKIGERIKKFYNGGKEAFTEDDVQCLSDMDGDLYFIYNIHRFIHFYASLNSVYAYRFNYITDLNMMKKLFSTYDVKGACHADDLFYIFYNQLNDHAYKEQEQLREIVFKITKMWTDFAKTGNPTPDDTVGVKWTPYTNGREILNLEENLSMGPVAERERIEFWNKLYKDGGLPHISRSNL